MQTTGAETCQRRPAAAGWSYLAGRAAKGTASARPVTVPNAVVVAALKPAQTVLPHGPPQAQRLAARTR
eukprot:15449645-Alexandrium_andersonii.AAC.1